MVCNFLQCLDMNMIDVFVNLLCTPLRKWNSNDLICAPILFTNLYLHQYITNHENITKKQKIFRDEKWDEKKKVTSRHHGPKSVHWRVEIKSLVVIMWLTRPDLHPKRVSFLKTRPKDSVIIYQSFHLNHPERIL